MDWVLYDNGIRHERVKCITLQNGQTHFKNLASFVARFLKYVLPFLDVMH